MNNFWLLIYGIPVMAIFAWYKKRQLARAAEQAAGQPVAGRIG